MRAVVFQLVLLVSLCACDRDARYCKLGETHVVGSSRAKVIDAIALAALHEGALLVWSDSDGTFGQRVDARGNPVGPSQRLAARCDGGLALVPPASAHVRRKPDAASEPAVLACARRAVPGDPAQRGELEVLNVSAGAAITAPRRARFESVGTLSEGVALARGPRGLALAYHDASPDFHRVWLVSELDAAGAAPALVSDASHMAFAPTLVFHHGELILAFSERVPRGDALESVVRVQRGRAAPIELALRSVHLTAVPQLVSSAERLWLAYRAAPSGARKPGLYVAPLERDSGSTLRALTPVRVGRADGASAPRLSACMGGIVSATPRSYSGDYFVGLNWLSPALARPRREQQFYEDARAFTQAAVACLGPGAGARALFALAELPQLDRAEAALHAATYTCE